LLQLTLSLFCIEDPQKFYCQNVRRFFKIFLGEFSIRFCNSKLDEGFTIIEQKSKKDCNQSSLSLSIFNEWVKKILAVQLKQKKVINGKF
jgi:hypothetical protein